MVFSQNLVWMIVQCQCNECGCRKEFDPVDKEKLLNTIQHGKLDKKQIEFAMKRIDSKLCESCFVGRHVKY